MNTATTDSNEYLEAADSQEPELHEHNLQHADSEPEEIIQEACERMVQVC